MTNREHRVFSGIPHSSAGLFFMRENIAPKGRYMIIVDEKKTYEKIGKIGTLLAGKNIKPI